MIISNAVVGSESFSPDLGVDCSSDRAFPDAGEDESRKFPPLEEDGIEVRFDSCMVDVVLRKHRRGEMPPYSAFVSELPRKLLKNFPVMLQYDQRRRFTGLIIFKPKRRAG